MRRRMWTFVHNAIARPLLGISGRPWATRFHDWTARRAWGCVDGEPD